MYEFGLSVIIPCYNAQNTIIQCIESIPNGCDLEIIIVDDCSTDASAITIQDYIHSSKRNIVFLKNEKNLGAGEARNRGIERATKEYIAFLDSDDQFSSTFINEIAKPISNGYDMIVYDANIVSKDHTERLDMFFSNSIARGLVNQKKALVFIKGCTCGKIYRTEIIQNNKIRFGNMPRNEDMVFTKIATAYSQNIYYLEIPLYCYYENKSSLMNDNSLINKENAVEAFNIVNHSLQNKGFEEELNSMFFLEVIYTLVLAELKTSGSAKQAKKTYRRFKNNYKRPDRYFREYSKKFKLSYYLFEINAFALFKVAL